MPHRHGSFTHEARWPAVVVGAGPAGLVTAIALARAGIRTLVVEEHEQPHPHPRATVASVRTMEILRSWGLEQTVRAAGDDVEFRMFFTPTIARVAEGTAREVGYPTRAQSEQASPTFPACIAQDALERILIEHLRTLPAATLLTGSTVESVEQDANEARLVLRDNDSRRTRRVRAQYVVGADGAYSDIRQQARIGVVSSGVVHEGISVLFSADLWSVVAEHRYVIYSVQDGGPATSLLPAGLGDRWLFAFGWDPGRERVADHTEAEFRARIRQATGVADLAARILHSNEFSFVAGIADGFRSRRILLIGDAAHRVTPRGGTGMNLAIADGFDVGWKLSWVLRGWADDALLDSYEAERRPRVQYNIDRSLRPDGSLLDAASGLRADLGDRIPHRWLPTTTGRRSTLDLLGPGLTLLTSRGTVDTPAQHVPTSIHRIDPALARELGLGESILLRPDGVPAGAEITGRAPAEIAS